MSNLPLLAAETLGTMRLDNGTRVMLAASARENTIGLGVVAGPPSKVASRYQIDLLIDALKMARVLSGDPPKTVKVMFSAPSDDGHRCLILCVGNTNTAMVVCPAHWVSSDDEEEEKSPRPKRYRYIGPESRVSPCKWRLNPTSCDPWCRNGDCPGEIDGECPFVGATGPYDPVKDLFEIVDSPGAEEGDDD